MIFPTGNKNFYKNSIGKQTKKILICAGTGCVAGGSLEIYDKLLKLMKEKTEFINYYKTFNNFIAYKAYSML